MLGFFPDVPISIIDLMKFIAHHVVYCVLSGHLVQGRGVWGFGQLLCGPERHLHQACVASGGQQCVAPHILQQHQRIIPLLAPHTHERRGKE